MIEPIPNRTMALVCEAGDPRTPSTWSGTPRNIIDALERQSVSICAIDGSVSATQHRIARAIHRLFSWKYMPQLGPVEKWFRYRKTVAGMRNSTATRILHMCTGDTPFYSRLRNFSHYMFVDTTFHSWQRYSLLTKEYSPGAIAMINRRERKAYHQMQHIFSISDYVKNDLVTFYGYPENRISVVGTGRGALKPFNGEKPGTPTILFVAKCRFEEKGGVLLVEAFRKVATKIPGVKLIIAGGDCPADIGRDCEQIEVLGHIDWEKLQSLFNEAWLFAMPALNEPWGLVYLEALACRTPILGLDRNSLPELTRQWSYGFAAKQPTADSVAEALIEAFSNRTRLLKMGVGGQEYALSNYSWERVAEHMIEVIFADKEHT